jgi:hypothetical protein
VRALIDLKTTAAECEHLWHERHAVELTVLVEGTQDFVLAANLEPVAYFWFACRQVLAEMFFPGEIAALQESFAKTAFCND